jgi:diguanylate cyclase (GGDEF)-like protein
MFLTIFFYTLSLFFQLFAAGYAINLFFRSQVYRLTCGFLALGLGLMVGRRISPLLHVLNNGHINLADAALSVPISLCLLLGMFQLRRALIEMEYKNFILDQSTKLDSLTGALSRMESFSRTQLEIERSFRSKQRIAFLMMDIDHFKNVNDQYGHPVGDIVLVNLVKKCREELRAIDIFGRVGGEEFLIVLPDTNQAQAIEVAERLRKHISSTACANIQGLDILITVSIGIAIFDPNIKKEEAPAAILRRLYDSCDRAMYRAKQAGRDQVCL